VQSHASVRHQLAGADGVASNLIQHAISASVLSSRLGTSVALHDQEAGGRSEDVASILSQCANCVSMLFTSAWHEHAVA
jgi:hypothetical protein